MQPPGRLLTSWAWLPTKCVATVMAGCAALSRAENVALHVQQQQSRRQACTTGVTTIRPDGSGTAYEGS